MAPRFSSLGKPLDIITELQTVVASGYMCSEGVKDICRRVDSYTHGESHFNMSSESFVHEMRRLIGNIIDVVGGVEQCRFMEDLRREWNNLQELCRGSKEAQRMIAELWHSYNNVPDSTLFDKSNLEQVRSEVCRIVMLALSERSRIRGSIEDSI